MIQEIITGILITAALIAALILIFRRFRKKPDAKDPCSGCGSDCTDCPMHEVMKKRKG
jgi:hypothetical protein